MYRVRNLFNGASWHIPSAYLAHYAPHPLYGYMESNRLIEELPAEHPDRFFEEIPDSKREAPREVVDEEVNADIGRFFVRSVPEAVESDPGNASVVAGADVVFDIATPATRDGTWTESLLVDAWARASSSSSSAGTL